jgi:hypothetical protein
MLKYGKGIVLFLLPAPSFLLVAPFKVPNHLKIQIQIQHGFANLQGFLHTPLQGSLYMIQVKSSGEKNIVKGYRVF